MVFWREELFAVFALELLENSEFSFSTAFPDCVFGIAVWAECLGLHEYLVFVAGLYKSDFGILVLCWVADTGMSGQRILEFYR